MAWFYHLLGIDKARAAFARLAAVVDLFTRDFDLARLKIRGTTDPARLTGPGSRKAKE